MNSKMDVHLKYELDSQEVVHQQPAPGAPPLVSSKWSSDLSLLAGATNSGAASEPRG